jgi:Na+/H+ antiporter NhaC
MKRCLLLFSLFFFLSGAGSLAGFSQAPVAPAAIADFRLQALNDSLFQLQLTDVAGQPVGYSGSLPFRVNGERRQLAFERGQARVVVPGEPRLLQFTAVLERESVARLFRPDPEVEGGVREVPMWLSLLPPLLAIFLALLFREVLLALFAGIWVGAFVIYGLSVTSFFTGFLAVADTFVVAALYDQDHISVILFSLLIGGMVAVISRNGGMAGVVNLLSRYARSARSSQLVTWVLGVAIFFDDYANTLIVGNTMRPVTDRYRISREKLAYIVDSTAAPVAAIAFVTTWIGAQLGYIQNAAATIGLEEGAYSLFLNSLEYAYYPILTLCFILLLIFTGRDYGSMHRAEVRARTTGTLQDHPLPGREQEAGREEMDEFRPVDPERARAVNALLPVGVVVLGTIAGLLYTGFDPAVWQDPELGFFRRLSVIIGASNSYLALVWASLSGAVLAILLTVGQRIMPLQDTMNTLISGFKTMMTAMLILTLAWALAAVTRDLYTAEYLTSLFSGNIPARYLPELTFTLAAVIAFSTGSSWGTMAILYPLMIPAAWYVSQAEGLTMAETMPILYNVISVVLAGSVFGDHCSPISDTTILSSLASGCNHIDHVKTQLPYAITVALVSNVVCTNLTDWGLPWYLIYPIGITLLWGIIRVLGKPVPEEGKKVLVEERV